ncbi:MAG TPA: acyl-CoA desaturase [Chryseolinea sp.]|nr:acyl-CoA desaturase [Chryseolinea sp.]
MKNQSIPVSGSLFFDALRKRVDGHFVEGRINTHGNGKLYIKAAIQVLSSVILYVTLVFFTPPVWIALALCLLLGLNLAVLGFNVMHEGGHQSFSKHQWINNVSAHFLNVLGGNAYFWKIKHNINHHTHTNVEGMDSDIDVKPFMRLHEGQPRHGYHRYQHVYFVMLYGISYLAWVFYEDFLKYFRGSVSTVTGPMKFTALRHTTFWVSKVLFVAVYMVVPIIMVGWLPWLVGFLIITVVCGIVISMVFQLAHVVEGTAFFTNKDDKLKQDWAIDQLRSTANFGTRSSFLHWTLGGLNFQIEHHLFPRISHIHYPAVSVHVRETCIEYGIRYNEYKSMFSAMVSHIALLRRLGRQLDTAQQ